MKKIILFLFSVGLLGLGGCQQEKTLGGEEQTATETAKTSGWTQSLSKYLPGYKRREHPVKVEREVTEITAGVVLPENAVTTECEGDVCYREVPVTKEVEEEYTAYKEVEKDCQVIASQQKITQVPSHTYRFVEEWVDTRVRVPYEVNKTKRVTVTVPVEEEFLTYKTVTREVPGTFDCARVTVTQRCECVPFNAKKEIDICDACGKVNGSIVLDIEGKQQIFVRSKITETAQCPTMKTIEVKVPTLGRRTVLRRSYVSTKVPETKYNVVNGKKLVRKRVPNMVPVNKISYEDKVLRTVKRRVMEPEKKTRLVEKTTYERKEVDCASGLEIIDPANEQEGATEAAAGNAEAASLAVPPISGKPAATPPEAG